MFVSPCTHQEISGWVLCHLGPHVCLTLNSPGNLRMDSLSNSSTCLSHLVQTRKSLDGFSVMQVHMFVSPCTNQEISGWVLCHAGPHDCLTFYKPGNLGMGSLSCRSTCLSHLVLTRKSQDTFSVKQLHMFVSPCTNQEISGWVLCHAGPHFCLTLYKPGNLRMGSLSNRSTCLSHLVLTRKSQDGFSVKKVHMFVSPCTHQEISGWVLC